MLNDGIGIYSFSWNVHVMELIQEIVEEEEVNVAEEFFITAETNTTAIDDTPAEEVVEVVDQDEAEEAIAELIESSDEAAVVLNSGIQVTQPEAKAVFEKLPTPVPYVTRMTN